MFFFAQKKSAEQYSLYLDEECSMLAGFIIIDEKESPVGINVLSFDNLLKDSSDDNDEDSTSKDDKNQTFEEYQDIKF